MLIKQADEASWQGALQASAEDCLAKRVNPDELLLRMRAIPRRSIGLYNAQIEVGELAIDPRRHHVWVGGIRSR